MSFRQPEREGIFPSCSPPLDAPIIEAEGCGAWGWPAYFGQDASGNVLVQARRWQLPQQPPDRYRGIGGRHGLRRTTGKGETTSNLASNIKLHAKRMAGQWHALAVRAYVYWNGIGGQEIGLGFRELSRETDFAQKNYRYRTRSGRPLL